MKKDPLTPQKNDTEKNSRFIDLIRTSPKNEAELRNFVNKKGKDMKTIRKKRGS